MSTRVTSAIASRKARENLARLLFPSDGLAASSSLGASSSASPLQDDTTGMKFTDRHSHSYRRRHRPRPGAAGDAAKGQREKRHSYATLRAAYLQRVHDMHPDKVMHRDQQQSSSEEGAAHQHNNNLAKDAHLQFIELKHAWEEYHASVRLVHDTGSTTANPQSSGQDDGYWEEDEESFTLFGVGCSFADNPEERALRDEIMDQACKGWFSSGSLSHEEGAGERDAKTAQQLRKVGDRPKTKLSDDGMFVRDDPMAAKYPRERKCLAPNMDRPRRKR
ncbi:hypothetical protein ACHAXT_005457 [Thalassiosira profunda]